MTIGRFPPNPGGGRRRQKAAALRAEQVLRLHVEGFTYSEIAWAEGITRQRVGQIVKAGLEDAAARTRELGDLLLERELEFMRLQSVEAWKVVTTKCVACGGDDSRRRACAECGRTGYLYEVGQRLAAMDRHQRVRDRYMKLLGLDGASYAAAAAAEKRREFYAPLEQIPDDELQAELERLLHEDREDEHGDQVDGEG